tara:strand:+ start:228 stop:656 length:429 start_codon:yes stop_codon:yes gene_type:complete
MIGLFTNIAPILIGFIMKLVAIKSKASTDLQKLQLEALSARAGQIDSARAAASKESPWAALNRRVIIFVLLGIIVFTQIAPVFLDVPTVIPTVIEGFSLFGFDITPDKIEYITVKGMLKLDEVFRWTTLIVEFYFGAQLAKG